MNPRTIARFLLSYVPILIISIIWSNQQIQHQTDRVIEIEKTQLNNKTNLLQDYYTQVVAGVHFWSSMPINPYELDSAFINNAIEYLEVYDAYDQFRILDLKGIEVFRLDKDNNNKVNISPDLQDKSDRYYFLESKSLNHHEVYISKIDLNEEYGKVEYPHQPVFRTIAPIYDSQNKKVGSVVVNYRANKLLDALRSKSEHSKHTITDNFNNIILAPNADITFLNQKDDSLKESNIQNTTDLLSLSKGNDTTITKNEGIWLSKHINLADDYNSNSANPHYITIKSPVELTYMSFIPMATLNKFHEPIVEGRLVFLIFCFILLLTLIIINNKRVEAKVTHINQLRDSNIGLREASKQLENKHKKLEALNYQLTLKNGQLREFNYLISHNLKAPMTSVTNLTEMLMESETVEEYQLLIPKLKKITDRVSELIEDMLQYVRILNSTQIETTQVNLNEIIDQSAELFLESIDNQEVKVIKELEDWNELEFSEHFMKSIIQNMISNSIKYRSTERESFIKFKTYTRGTKKILEISDNGIGLDLKKHGDQVFKLYKRFHRDISGKGLGLFLIKSQLESLNASIFVDSKPNQGIKFTITFNTNPNDASYYIPFD